MTDAEIRIECIKAAAATPGNPNHIQMAREYYSFVTEGQEAQKEPEAAEETSEDTTTRKKATRK